MLWAKGAENDVRKRRIQNSYSFCYWNLARPAGRNGPGVSYEQSMIDHEYISKLLFCSSAFSARRFEASISSSGKMQNELRISKRAPAIKMSRAYLAPWIERSKARTYYVGVAKLRSDYPFCYTIMRVYNAAATKATPEAIASVLQPAEPTVTPALWYHNS